MPTGSTSRSNLHEAPGLGDQRATRLRPEVFAGKAQIHGSPIVEDHLHYAVGSDSLRRSELTCGFELETPDQLDELLESLAR